MLDRQFPIDSPHQKLSLRTAKDYADRLSINVNHLYKVFKENTGNTTTDLISRRVIQEAKIVLKQPDWKISKIAYSLGFKGVAHFSNFFRKQASFAPLGFRSRLLVELCKNVINVYKQAFVILYVISFLQSQ